MLYREICLFRVILGGVGAMAPLALLGSADVHVPDILELRGVADGGGGVGGVLTPPLLKTGGLTPHFYDAFFRAKLY